FLFFSSRRRHTRSDRDWSSDVCSSDLLFWTVSGSHLYGFPSADSDVDLRGSFAAPVPSLLGLRPPTETHEIKDTFAGRETEAVRSEERRVGKERRSRCVPGRGREMEVW